MDGRGRQGGITLLLSILVLLTLTFIGFGLMEFTGFDSDVSSNAAQEAAALQASDVGLEAASQALIGLSACPLSGTTRRWLYVPPPTTPPNGGPAVTEPAPPPTNPLANPPTNFWQTCQNSTTTNNTCGVVQGWNGNAAGVPFAGQQFTVEYVVEPIPSGAQTLNGYEHMPGGTTDYVVYDAYVYVFRDRPGTNTVEAGTLVEAGIRKICAS